MSNFRPLLESDLITQFAMGVEFQSLCEVLRCVEGEYIANRVRALGPFAL